MADLEGELVPENERTVTTFHDDQHATVQLPAQPATVEHAPAVFNPLDAEPARFTQALKARQENYDNLVEHLRGQLVPGVDFGRIHHDKNCYDSPCDNDRHWSGYDLWAAGADKIIGILNLSAEYPGLEKFTDACLSGVQILETIIQCNVVSMSGQIIADGVGACSRDEPGLKPKGNLNACIKRAAKRARVHATKQLPTVGALFDDQDFWKRIEAGYRADRAKAREIRKYSTGAMLEVFPLGKRLNGVRFADMNETQLRWILDKCPNMPDIWNAAQRALEALATSSGASEPAETGTTATPGPGPRTPEPSSPRGRAPDLSRQSTGDWLEEYENG